MSATNDVTTQRAGTKEVRTIEVTFNTAIFAAVAILFAGMYFGYSGAKQPANAATVTPAAVKPVPKS